jgi:ribosomal protein S18 acetylase RimI-like enzyme
MTEILEDKNAISLQEINRLTAKVGWGDPYYETEEKWRHTCDMSGHFAYVKEKNQLIAFGRVLEDGQMCMFYDVCVDPAYQKKGLGSLIMNHLIDKVKDRQYASIGLFVWHGNASAAEFYQRFGFKIAPAMELTKHMKHV